MSLPKTGNLAPKFTLENQNGKKIALKDYIGKNVVLYFYPKALTPGCTTQACDIRDYKKEFSKLKTVVLGLSPDPVDKLKKFEEKKDLNFDLLSDVDHKIADKYGVWGLKKFMGKEYMGIRRSTFIINKKGKLVHVIENVKTKPHADNVLNYIKENLK